MNEYLITFNIRMGDVKHITDVINADSIGEAQAILKNKYLNDTYAPHQTIDIVYVYKEEQQQTDYSDFLKQKTNAGEVTVTYIDEKSNLKDIQKMEDDAFVQGVKILLDKYGTGGTV